MSNRAQNIVVGIGVIVVGTIGYFAMQWWRTPPASTVPTFTQATSTPLFPTATPIIPRAQPSNTSAQTPPPTQTFQTSAKAHQLISTPAAGIASFHNRARYVDAAVGHVYELAPGEKIPTTLSNTTVPKVGEALFGNDSTLLVRYLSGPDNRVDNLLATLTSTTTSTGNLQGNLDGALLPPSVREAAFSPDGARMFLLADLGGGEGTTGIVIDAKGASGKSTAQKRIWTSPLSEWLVSWPASDAITLLTKPSAQVAGSLFFLHPSTQNASKMLGGILGLTALASPDGKKVLYSQSTPQGFITYLLDTVSGAQTIFSAQTLPEKCVWSKKNADIVYCGVPGSVPPAPYPDFWYQGIVSFSDAFWKVDVSTGQATLLATPNAAVDAVSLALDDEEANLYLINRNDMTPWVVSLQ